MRTSLGEYLQHLVVSIPSTPLLSNMPCAQSRILEVIIHSYSSADRFISVFDDLLVRLIQSARQTDSRSRVPNWISRRKSFLPE
ncbi:hypothetical protein PENTCL1PPCAC_9961, partial [Pristionchus entomophagus]